MQRHPQQVVQGHDRAVVRVEALQRLVELLAIVVGTIAFAGLGLLLAGTLRAEATLALSNGLFLGFLMLGGIVLPVDHLPDLLRPIASALPATALADLLRISLASGAASAGVSLTILAAWAIAATTLAVRTFRWD